MSARNIDKCITTKRGIIIIKKINKIDNRLTFSPNDNRMRSKILVISDILIVLSIFLFKDNAIRYFIYIITFARMTKIIKIPKPPNSIPSQLSQRS